MWVILGAISAALLGIYDIFQKLSLKKNAVLPVLFFSTLSSAIIFIPILFISHFNPDLAGHFWYIKPQSLSAHLHFMLKSVIVGTSWVLSYFAIKHLPITIASPIRSSGPMWTLVGAILIFGERMNLWQWIGLITTIGFYYLFSLSGKEEGISFRTNKWVLFMTLATIVGSISGLYDKYLVAHFDRVAMQCWFCIYMVPLTAALLLFIWLPNRKQYAPFHWRYTIILIGATLTVADFVYFWALSYPDSLIAIVSTIRRGSIIVSFTLGAILFKEKNIKRKTLILLGIIAGIVMIILGGWH
ncbi:MAG: DMT family transporter [Bacteroidota bacterium]|nr:DMT family transporter [Bacteroidota bacterium]